MVGFTNKKTVGLMSLVRNRRLLWDMFTDVFRKRYRLSGFGVLALIATVAYVLMPLDLIPDLLPIVGWLDDGMLIYLLLFQLRKELKRYKSWRERQDATPVIPLN